MSTDNKRQDAKERSQSWADLSKKERKEKRTAGETKKSYNKSTGYRAEQVAIENAAQFSNSNGKRPSAQDLINKYAPEAAAKKDATPAPTPTPTPESTNRYGDPIGTVYRGGSPTFNERTGKSPTPESTNRYGDPIGTVYRGGSPTFNESTGQYESYTGADGTVTIPSNTQENEARQQLVRFKTKVVDGQHLTH